MPSVVFVDSNAAEASIADDLQRRLGIEVERARLDVGDVVVQNERMSLTIERKTYKDLDASILDGRYRDQKARMMVSDRAEQRHCYVIVHPTAPSSVTTRHWWPSREDSAADAKRCAGAVLHTAIRDGIPVFIVDSNDGFVDFVASVKRSMDKHKLLRVEEGVHYKPVSAKKPQGVTKRRELEKDASKIYSAMLEQVPGVSLSTAQALLSSFPTFADLYAATKEEIASVRLSNRMLGPAIAGRVFNVMHITP